MREHCAGEGGSMKCVCGYDDEKKAAIERDFIRVDSVCAVYESETTQELEKSDIFACPKCGTLKIEV